MRKYFLEGPDIQYNRHKMAEMPLETQVGVTSQINKWANTDPRTCRWWNQVPRSKHPL
jgi:hypothetical protein